MRSRRVSSRGPSLAASARPGCSRRLGRASPWAASARPTNVRAQFSTWCLRWPRTSPGKASKSTADSGLPEGRLHVKASEGRTGLLVSPQNSASEGLELEIIHLPPGGQEAGVAIGKETLLVVLGGRIDLQVNGVRWDGLGQRANVFGGRATSAYLPPSTEYLVRSPAGAEVALCRAPAGPGGAPYVIAPDDVDVATRGRDSFEREVHTILDTRKPAAALVAGGKVQCSRRRAALPPPQANSDRPTPPPPPPHASPPPPHPPP